MPLKKKLESETAPQRGADLRKKMEESEQYGQQYRADHQGADAIKKDIKHEEIESPDEIKGSRRKDLTEDTLN